MTISDKAIVEFAEACGMTAEKLDAVSEVVLSQQSMIETLEKRISGLEDRITLITGFAQGQQSRIEKLEGRIHQLEKVQ